MASAIRERHGVTTLANPRQATGMLGFFQPMSHFPLKPNHKPVKDYYAALAQFHQHDHKTEGNTRSAFESLLRRCASAYDWHLVGEYQFKGTNKQPLRADGALVDDLTLVHGLWEAKDSADDLQKEIKAKVARGYPLTNILFQSPDRAVLYQDNRIALDCDLTDPEKLIEVLELFFEHRQPHEVDWEDAVVKFSEKIPDLAGGVTKILEAEYVKNTDFRERFDAFAELCRQSINPDLTDDAIRKMLVQHLLTERIFRKVFNNSEFLTRNVIAAEIERVIRSITARHFSRDAFLQPLDRFYTAIERAAESQTGYTEKQHFLNAVYEKFFQSFDKKQADTHGIVYTPQPIVDFMVRSVEEVLHAEFGKGLSDENVHILDPFTGTGNFITRIMQEIKKSRLPQKYANELHCNEIMLLPYYIASMNIEHAYMEAMKQYKPFEGICLIDTFELSEFGQQSFAFTHANTERVIRQKRSHIFVIIGNPPYNAGQVNENDQNRNRLYPHWDRRIKNSYAKDSAATLRNKLSDPYVKAFRWASDRIRLGGIVAFISNNSFIDQVAFDGMRKHLSKDYSKLYILDLGGNVRKNPKLSGTTHNVFGIQVGVAISILVKDENHDSGKAGRVFYARMPEIWRKGQKYSQLQEWASIGAVPWKRLRPDSKFAWLNSGIEGDFQAYLTLGAENGEAIFQSKSLGISTNRDAWVYGFDATRVAADCDRMAESFNSQLALIRTNRLRRNKNKKLNMDPKVIAWSSTLLSRLDRGTELVPDEEGPRISTYRPFTHEYIYFADGFIDRPSQWKSILTGPEVKNKIICVAGVGHQKPFQTLASCALSNLDLLEKTQCFPFYSYDEDGTNRRENITDWSRDQFRAHYADKKITKWDIFHYTYALLHHPGYRERYAANLKRELPRLPYAPNFHAFAKAGKRLMELHVDYEKQPEYPLEEIETPKVPWTMRVEKMRLSQDKSEIKYNEALTLRGIPPAVFEYRLGNRSALDWVIDQYRVSTDKRSGIVNDPNRKTTKEEPDAERYILRLIGQVITVSLETVKIVKELAALPFRPEEA
jgi:predicted helicase